LSSPAKRHVAHRRQARHRAREFREINADLVAR